MGSEIENMFSGGQSQGYGDLQNYLQQAQGMSNGNFQQGMSGLNPYMQAGSSSLPQIQQLLQQMQGQNNGQWMQNYKESPYATYLTGKETNAMNNAAAAGGTLGTGANQQAVGTLANNITAGDMQNYFNNMMTQNQQQLGGYQNLAGMGANAANQGANLGLNYSQLISQLLSGQGQAAANQDVANQTGKNSALSGLAGLII